MAVAIAETIESVDFEHVEAIDICTTSEAAHKLVEASGRLLREDAAFRNRFYGEMGVVRTELNQGNDVQGMAVYYKDERVQLSRSYKSRGASYGVMLGEGTPVAESTGNHGGSVGIAALRAGRPPAEIQGTDTMSPAKILLQDRAGSNLTFHPDFTAAQKARIKLAEKTGFFAVPPFGSPEVVAGQCTLGEELVEDLVRLNLADEHVVIPVPVAGGGLISGFALAVRRAKQQGVLGPNIQIFGVQPENNDTMNRALTKIAAGELPVGLYAKGEQDKDCDALAIGEDNLSQLTMTFVGDTDYVGGMYTVDKLAVARAMRELETELGGDVEPAAALSRAFLNTYASYYTGTYPSELPVFVLPITGGNKSQETDTIYRKVETEAAQKAFLELSKRYTARYADSSYSEMDEVLEIAAADAAISRVSAKPVVRKMARAALSGLTAEFRSGPVRPVP